MLKPEYVKFNKYLVRLRDSKKPKVQGLRKFLNHSKSWQVRIAKAWHNAAINEFSRSQLKLIGLLGALCFSNLLLASNNSVFKTIKEKSPGASQTQLTPDYSAEHTKVPVKIDGGDFFVLSRVDRMERQPCKHCHEGVKQGSLSQKPVTSRKAHWDISLKHPSIAKDCNLCHDHKAELVTIDKAPIEFNHSYKLCAQCHGVQYKDWQGGAHGKRIGGWTGKRLVQNCTGCHNPHDPKFERRRPATYATQGTR